MKKIKTVFKINKETDLATEEVNADAQWVLDGKGFATLKIDGTSCMIKNGEIYKRFDKKLKSQFMKALRANSDFKVESYMFNELPEGAIPCEEKPDPFTYHHPHWVKCSHVAPEDKYHFEAFKKLNNPQDGTYELIGPKICLNPYQLNEHLLVPHGKEILNVPDRTYEGLKNFLETLQGEGVVFYNPENDDMKKIRKKDFLMFWSHEDVRTVRKQQKNKMK